MVTLEVQLIKEAIPSMGINLFVIIFLTMLSFIGALVSDEGCWGFIGLIVKQFKRGR